MHRPQLAHGLGLDLEGDAVKWICGLEVLIAEDLVARGGLLDMIR